MRDTRFLLSTGLVALLFAAAAVLPYVAQRIDPSSNFAGIVIMPTDAEIHYAARVREIADGFWETGNTFYSSPKDQPFLQPPTPEMAIAGTAWLLHIDPVYAFMLFSVLGAIALVFTMVGFFSSVTSNKWAALLAVIVLLFAGKFLGSPWEILSVFRVPNPDAPVFDYLRFSRPVNPLWTGPWFFGFLWLLSLYIQRGGYARGAAAMATLLVLVWSYVYAWTFAVVVLGLLVPLYFLSKDQLRLKRAAGLLGVFAILVLPYLMHMYDVSHHPLFVDSSRRIGMIASHMPIMGAWAIFFPIIALVYRPLWGKNWPVVLGCGLAGIIALNQHVITGKFIVPHHYHWYFIQPLASAFTVLVVFLLLAGLPSLQKNLKSSFWIIAVLCIAWGFWQQTGRYREMAPLWASFQRYEPVVDYFREQGKAGEVVYSPQWDLLDLLPIYTSVDVYTSTNANNYLVSDAQARDAYFFELWLKGVTPQQAAKDFSTTRRKELSSRIYAIYYREYLGDYTAIPDNVVAKHLAEYRAYVRKSLTEKIHLYPLTYLVVDAQQDLTPELRSVRGQGTTVWSDDRWSIVRMDP